MRTGPRLVVVTILVLGAGGCIRRDGLNSDCRWPGETAQGPVSARHLSADAEFAEDLAIRYADTHFGRHSANPSETYPTERDQCMARLFEEIGKEHGVPAAQVSRSLGRNRGYIDGAEVLPFALLYWIAAILAGRLIWRRYPPADEGWAPGIAMALFVSLAFAVGSVLLGEVWNWFVESHRMGNHHMSYRADRLFWVRHQFAIFTASLIIFGLASLAAARRVRLHELPGDRPTG